MKVKDLITKLKNVNPESEVEVSVYSRNQVYPVFCQIGDDCLQRPDDSITRIECSLPKCFIPDETDYYYVVSKRKEK